MQFLRSLTKHRLREFNPCHMPAGTSEGGQFAPKGEGHCAGPAHGPIRGEWTKSSRAVRSRRATTGPMRPATKAERKRYVIPPSFVDAMVSTDPRSEVRATAVSPTTGKKRAFYSKSYTDRQALAKWSRIAGIHRQIPAIIKRVDKDTTKPSSPDYQPAMALRLILQTGMRNGAENESGTYGASSLLLSHVRVIGDMVAVDIAFPGKDKVPQQYLLHDPVLAKYVRARERALREEAPLFDIGDDDTLAYMKKVAGSQYKVHDLRTWYGTVYADQLVTKLLSEGLQPRTKKERKAFQKQVSTKVAKALGNTPAVTLKTYIHPWVWKAVEGDVREAALREFNDCNLPGGQGDGGQFGRNDDPRCGPMHGPERPDFAQKKAGLVMARDQANRAYYGSATDSPEEQAAIARRRELAARLGPLQRQVANKAAAREETTHLLDQIKAEQEIAALRAQGIKPPEVTTQDTSTSSTKKQSYTAGDNVSGVEGPTGPVDIFDGRTAEDVAHAMTKYLSEEMSVEVEGESSGGYDDVSDQVGPPPDEARSDYERYASYARAQVDRAYRNEQRTAFMDLAESEVTEAKRALEDALVRHAFAASSVDPNADVLNGEKLAAILDKHGLFGYSIGAGTQPYAQMVDDSLEGGDTSPNIRAKAVVAALFDENDSAYDRPRVAAARAEILALRPMAVMRAYVEANESEVPKPGAMTAGIEGAASEADAGAQRLFAQSRYLSLDLPREEAAARWLQDSETRMAQDLDYSEHVNSFEQWYTDQYGHDPGEWDDRVSSVGGGRITGEEVTLKFEGDSGSSITRIFSKDYEGNLNVYHSYFRNQGEAGQGKDLMRGQMEIYEQMGIHEITTSANLSTGAYAWARYGFKAKSPSALASNTEERLRKLIERAPELALASDHIFTRISDYEDSEDLPWRIADLRLTGDPKEIQRIAQRFTHKSGYWRGVPDDVERWDADLIRDSERGVFNIGKVLLSGQSWSAYFQMGDEDQRARMRAYIGDWTVPAR